jgi:hypothetical protein
MKMANRISTFWLPCIGMALWPAVAVANAGTPLMWARGIHLFIGNLAIGIGEGCLLAILFRKRAAPCIGVMIAANYFSAWIGGSLLTPKLSDSLGLAFNIGDVSRLGTAGKSGWRFWSGFWALEGLNGENAKDGRRLHLSLETPFLEWYIRNATQLPGDQVVFQLGRDQICILDPDAKKIALLARGWGPIVAIRDN